MKAHLLILLFLAYSSKNYFCLNKSTNLTVTPLNIFSYSNTTFDMINLDSQGNMESSIYDYLKNIRFGKINKITIIFSKDNYNYSLSKKSYNNSKHYANIKIISKNPLNFKSLFDQISLKSPSILTIKNACVRNNTINYIPYTIFLPNNSIKFEYSTKYTSKMDTLNINNSYMNKFYFKTFSAFKTSFIINSFIDIDDDSESSHEMIPEYPIDITTVNGGNNSFIKNQIIEEITNHIDRGRAIKIRNSFFKWNGEIYYIKLININSDKKRILNPFPRRNAQEIICSNLKDCFNCSATLNNFSRPICSWSNGKCNSLTNGTLPKYWWRLFDNCIDEPSNAITRRYCGENNANVPVSVELPSDNKVYGAKNLYCKYTIYSYVSGAVLFLFNRYYLNQDLFAIGIMLEDGNIQTEFIQSSWLQWTIQGVKRYEIYYYSSNYKYSSPFKISFDTPGINGFNYLGLFISIGVLVFVCFICSLIVYKCSRRIIEQNQQNRLRRGDENREPEQIVVVIGNNTNREQNLRQKNSLLLDQLFKEELKPHLYIAKENEFSSNCTICLESFNEKSEVNILTCHHIFHHSCLKEWLFKNVLNVPKCPNCNLLISTKWENQENENRQSPNHRNTNNNIVQLNILGRQNNQQ